MRVHTDPFRHRFTASLLTELLRFSYASPHKVFNACIKKICGFYPTDGGPLVGDEGDINESEVKVRRLDFKNILQRKPNVVCGLRFKSHSFYLKMSGDKRSVKSYISG